MRHSLSERFKALSSSVPRVPAGRRSPLPLSRWIRRAALSGALFACTTAPAAAQADVEKAKTYGELLGALVTIHVQSVSHARAAASAGHERRGTGIAVDPGGLVLTSALLVQEADSIVLTTFDGRTLAAAVAAQDPLLGVAVLRPAEPLGVRPLSLGRSDALDVRAPVSVASAARSRAVAVATVVAKREFAGEHEYLVENAIFTAPPIHDCAGAALVDGAGKLVGVGAFPVKTIPGAAAGPAAGNIFIPVEHFLPVLAHLADRTDESAAVRKPWLGLVTAEDASGIRVVQVLPNSPAERAGVRAGDVLHAVGGAAVRSRAELYRGIWRTGGPGTAIRLTIERDGTLREIRVRAIDPQDYFIHRA
jgi:S1-C subfamily serine protease